MSMFLTTNAPHPHWPPAPGGSAPGLPRVIQPFRHHTIRTKLAEALTPSPRTFQESSVRHCVCHLKKIFCLKFKLERIIPMSARHCDVERIYEPDAIFSNTNLSLTAFGNGFCFEAIKNYIETIHNKKSLM